MDKIARLRQEIERRIKLYDGNNNQELWIGNTYRAVLSFLDTLSEEPDKSLEEAAEEYSKRVSDGHNYRDLTCGFIAGAEWQASQMPMPEDTVLFQKGVAEGRRLEREDMMKDAISCEVDWYDGPILNYSIDESCEVLSKMDIDVGDKVRIVVLKEEE